MISRIFCALPHQLMPCQPTLCQAGGHVALTTGSSTDGSSGSVKLGGLGTNEVATATGEVAAGNGSGVVLKAGASGLQGVVTTGLADEGTSGSMHLLTGAGASDGTGGCFLWEYLSLKSLLSTPFLVSV